MNNQQGTGVMHLLVQQIVDRAGGLEKALKASRFSEVNTDLNWDENQYGDDVNLDNDKGLLRDLEAEIYSLTDQFKTEQNLKGAGFA